MALSCKLFQSTTPNGPTSWLCWWWPCRFLHTNRRMISNGHRSSSRQVPDDRSSFSRWIIGMKTYLFSKCRVYLFTVQLCDSSIWISSCHCGHRPMRLWDSGRRTCWRVVWYCGSCDVTCTATRIRTKSRRLRCCHLQEFWSQHVWFCWKIRWPLPTFCIHYLCWPRTQVPCHSLSFWIVISLVGRSFLTSVKVYQSKSDCILSHLLSTVDKVKHESGVSTSTSECNQDMGLVMSGHTQMSCLTHMGM